VATAAATTIPSSPALANDLSLLDVLALPSPIAVTDSQLAPTRLRVQGLGFRV
jgi:hypothetical protein